LVELASPESYGAEYKTWNLNTLPIIPDAYILEVSEKTEQQFNVLKKLMARPDVTELIEATDAGREGELIFRLVYEKANCRKPFKRLWISSMEEKSIREGLATVKPGSDYDTLYYAALCRQRADWLLGMNLTRLYSKMYGRILKCGRVQTPTVNLIVKRQREILNFVPQTYFRLIADIGSFKAYGKTNDAAEAKKITGYCVGKDAVVSDVQRSEKKENPAALYDLTGLQRDANRLLGYSAKETLDLLQSLYDAKLATYPRTDSRYITSDMEQSAHDLISVLLSADILDVPTVENYDIQKINVRCVVNDKKVTDHHAILPTSGATKKALATLPIGEKNILLLLVYRLLSAVYTPHVYAATTAVLDIGGYAFTATGKEIIDSGFKAIEPRAKAAIKAIEDEDVSETPDETLPEMNAGDMFKVQNVTAEKKKTQPPKTYTEDTLLSAMETAGKTIADEELKEAMKNCGLGTPATRAGIIENIINTGYIKREGKKLIPTETACTFIDLVTDKIKEPGLTAEWEKQLSDIHQGKFPHTDFLNNVAEFLRSFVADTKASYSPEQNIGVFENRNENGNSETIGICPLCGSNVVDRKKLYSCEKGGCGFAVWKTIAGKQLTASQAKKLLSKGKTDLIKGFTNKAGKPFEAYLKLKDDNTTGFEFPQNPRGRN
jgi:DNA topoisomerase-3